MEDWILDSKNSTEFDRFLVSQWDDHVEQHLDVDIMVIRKSDRFKWWAAAAATVTIVFGAYYYSKETAKMDQIAIASVHPQVRPMPSRNVITNETFHSEPKPQTISHDERKTFRNQPVQILAETDTVNREKRPLSVKSTKLENFMINKIAIHKLLDSIGSNQFVLMNFDVHEITFQRLAVMLREECGIVLEPCSGTGSGKTYTARFERISVPDLLNDMSEKMMFSYSIQDNKVKICFN